MTTRRRNVHRVWLAPLWIATAGVVFLSVYRPAAAVILQFDYTYDTLGFFDDPARREVLELAGSLVNRFVDRLVPIEPAGESSWSIYPACPPVDPIAFCTMNESRPTR